MFAYQRSLATATKTKEVLPLKGIKVLDMTRVLAGVSCISLFFLCVLHSSSSDLYFCFVVLVYREEIEHIDLGPKERKNWRTHRVKQRKRRHIVCNILLIRQI
jgi:hypothetical protein